MRYEKNFAIAGYQPPPDQRYILQGIIFSSKDARTFDIKPQGVNLPNKFSEVAWNIVPYNITAKELTRGNFSSSNPNFDKEYYTLQNELRVKFVWRTSPGMKHETSSSYFCREALRPFSLEGVPLFP